MPEEQHTQTLPTFRAEQVAPTLETDPAQESLASALRASFNILRVVMVVLLAAYFLSGWFKVDPGEQGLVARFGKLCTARAGGHVFGSGSHLRWPDPFEEKIHLSGAVFELEIDTFLFSRSKEDMGKQLSEILPNKEKLTPGADGAMYTGDQSLCHGLWRIQYEISDAEAFVDNMGESAEAFEPILQRLAENSIVHTVAGQRVEDVLGKGIEKLTSDIRRRLQKELSDLDSGVKVSNVVAETIEPGRVRPAFRNVSQAENEKQRLIEEAEQKRQEILNQAAGPQYEELLALIQQYGAAQTTDADAQRLQQLRDQIDAKLNQAGGQVAKLLREAQTRDSQIRAAIRREFEDFTYQLEAYRKHPALTTMRLWQQMREAILSSKENEILFVPPFGEIEILVNTDPNRAIEAEIERYRRQGQPLGGGRR
jgi:membrane protease subunit HflK